jgi:hypothetical protein
VRPCTEHVSVTCMAYTCPTRFSARSCQTMSPTKWQTSTGLAELSAELCSRTMLTSLLRACTHVFRLRCFAGSSSPGDRQCLQWVCRPDTGGSDVSTVHLVSFFLFFFIHFSFSRCHVPTRISCT